MNLASFSLFHFFTFYLSRAFSILLTYLSIYLANRKIIYLLFDSHKSEIEIETRDKKKKKRTACKNKANFCDYYQIPPRSPAPPPPKLSLLYLVYRITFVFFCMTNMQTLCIYIYIQDIMLSGLYYLLTAAHEESSRALSFIPSRSMCRLSFYRVGFFFTE